MNELEALLRSTRVGDRKKGAKRIGKDCVAALGPLLAEVLVAELARPKAWQAQCVMIESLGKIAEPSALPVVEEVCHANKPHDMVTQHAARAFVRIRRTGLDDDTPIRALLAYGDVSVVSGALWCIGEDRMRFSDEATTDLLSHVDAFEPKKTPGTMDIRNGIAVAAAGWNPDLVGDFLRACAEQTADPTLAKHARNALSQVS